MYGLFSPVQSSEINMHAGLISEESAILKNTLHSDIFSISLTSREHIDHVTFSNLLLSVKFHNFFLGTI
jgi:hypothetical protein